jgi:hypothetical protein
MNDPNITWRRTFPESTPGIDASPPRTAPRFRMRLVCTAAQVAIVSLTPSLAALAESGDSGAQQAGGAFMTSYPPAATAPTRASPQRGRGRGPTSLPQAVARGLISPSEAARLQEIAEGGF